MLRSLHSIPSHLSLLLLLALPPIASQAQVYKCVGADGRVSYVQTPSDAARCESARIKAPPPGSSPHVESLNKFVQQADKSNAAAKASRAKSEEEAAVRESRCNAARGDLKFLEREGATYFVIDDSGERQAINAEQHQQRVQQARERVAAACDG